MSVFCCRCHGNALQPEVTSQSEFKLNAAALWLFVTSLGSRCVSKAVTGSDSCNCFKWSALYAPWQMPPSVRLQIESSWLIECHLSSRNPSWSWHFIDWMIAFPSDASFYMPVEQYSYDTIHVCLYRQYFTTDMYHLIHIIWKFLF